MASGVKNYGIEGEREGREEGKRQDDVVQDGGVGGVTSGERESKNKMWRVCASMSEGDRRGEASGKAPREDEREGPRDG